MAASGAMPANDAAVPATGHGTAPRACSIERLALTNFRNYRDQALSLMPSPIVLTGANGAGKTNLLEAVSLLAPGQGLRRAPYAEIARLSGAGDWAVAARVNGAQGPVEIGTGLAPGGGEDRAQRIVRIDRRPAQGSGALADHVEMIWLTPAMDALFMGPAGDRRRFLDRLILCFDPAYRTRLAQFERAMRQRNRLLEIGTTSGAHIDGLELQLAETGVAIAAARREAVNAVTVAGDGRRARNPGSPFPWASLALVGTIEDALAARPAIEVEDSYRATLRQLRERDRQAGRTLAGPHRSDLAVTHGPKAMPARKCSTGEQKALLVGLVLAHAELVAGRRDGVAPLLLLDEIAAHLDAARRAALFDEIIALGVQAWMTGTDRALFTALTGRAQFATIEDGRVSGIP